MVPVPVPPAAQRAPTSQGCRTRLLLPSRVAGHDRSDIDRRAYASVRMRESHDRSPREPYENWCVPHRKDGLSPSLRVAKARTTSPSPPRPRLCAPRARHSVRETRVPFDRFRQVVNASACLDAFFFPEKAPCAQAYADRDRCCCGQLWPRAGRSAATWRGRDYEIQSTRIPQRYKYFVFPIFLLESFSVRKSRCND